MPLHFIPQSRKKNEVNVSNLESGIYIVNVDGKSTKILKNKEMLKFSI